PIHRPQSPPRLIGKNCGKSRALLLRPARSSTVVHSLAVRLAKPQPLHALLLANMVRLACPSVALCEAGTHFIYCCIVIYCNASHLKKILKIPENPLVMDFFDHGVNAWIKILHCKTKVRA
ncbi:MAG: hypothetical protein IKA65_10055, partial [Lentisphaeria bacterium]|nr:hypothetical protein [Lentisphaeria bacterium]